MAFQRGLNENQEQSTQSMVRDTRTLGMRVSDFFKDRIKTCIFLGALALFMVLFPGLVEIFSCWFNLFFLLYHKKIHFAF